VLRFNLNPAATLKLIHYPAVAALECAILRTTPGSSVNIANGGGQIFETLGQLVGRPKSARRQPFVDVQSDLQLPGPASQKVTLPALREAFDLLFDAKSFQRQVLVE
jgi:hypothetical protein